MELQKSPSVELAVPLGTTAFHKDVLQHCAVLQLK